MPRKRKRNKSSKGGVFEREFCRELSLWWSKEKRDDLFWRSAGSGAMATVRSRKGKKTEGHYGDITATGKRGRPFLRLFALELKRGYARAQNVTVSQCVTCPKNRKIWTLIDWIAQARKSKEGAGAKNWMIVHREDRCEALVYVSLGVWNRLVPLSKSLGGWGMVYLPKHKTGLVCRVGFLPLAAFFKLDPDSVQSQLEDER